MQLGSKKTAFPTFSSGFPTCNEVSVKDIQVIRLNVPDPFADSIGGHGMEHGVPATKNRLENPWKNY